MYKKICIILTCNYLGLYTKHLKFLYEIPKGCVIFIIMESKGFWGDVENFCT